MVSTVKAFHHVGRGDGDSPGFTASRRPRRVFSFGRSPGKAFPKAMASESKVNDFGEDEEKPMEVSSPRSWQRGPGATDSSGGEKPRERVFYGKRTSRGQILERGERYRRGKHFEGLRIEEKPSPSARNGSGTTR